MKPIKAWHFCRNDYRLGYDDGRKVEAGVTHTVEDEPKLCEVGLHGSINAFDALQYAPGNIVSRVLISGSVQHGDDKLVGKSREYLWVANAEEPLREFARWCALEVIHLWDAPEIVVRYLYTGDDSLRDSAWAALRAAAARDALRAAAWDALRAAARDAAWAAVRDAAWDAARAAAVRGAAWDAINKKANDKLTELLNELGPKTWYWG